MEDNSNITVSKLIEDSINQKWFNLENLFQLRPAFFY